jgi:hypothetical protein
LSVTEKNTNVLLICCKMYDKAKLYGMKINCRSKLKYKVTFWGFWGANQQIKLSDFSAI